MGAVSPEGGHEGPVSRVEVGDGAEITNGQGQAGEREAGPASACCVSHDRVIHVGDVKSSGGDIRGDQQIRAAVVPAQGLAPPAVAIPAGRGVLGVAEHVDVGRQIVLDGAALLHSVLA